MSNYLDLLVQQDRAAQNTYSFDPRIMMQSTRGYSSVEPFSNGGSITTPEVSYTN